MKRISLPYYYSRSGAKFEPTDSFLDNTNVVDTNKEKLENVGIPVAQIDHDTYATTKEEMHCFVIGETGSGKTRRVILPSIRLLAKSGESMVVSDPKGELYRYTADALKKRGYDVKVLNFRKPRCGNRWNPLALIEEFCTSKEADDRDKGVMMLDDLVSIISGNIKDASDPYWSSSAAGVFRGAAQLILTYGKKGDLTFENIARIAREVYRAYASKRNYGNSKNREIQEFLSQLPKDSTIIQNLNTIIVNADTTRDCIMSIFEAMISMYCSQELLLDLFSKSEIDVAQIGKKPTALFFILPDDSDAMYPIATYFVKQVYSTLISLADEQPSGELPNKVTFLLDEFANFAKIPTIHAMLTAARSRKIRFVLVCQSMDQLIEKYKESGMEIMLSNCRVWIYMSCRNLPFLRRLQDLAGNYTSPYTHETCPLIDVGTLQHFPMGQILVFNDRCRPVIGYLDDYSTYDFGEEGFGEMSPIPEPRELEERNSFSLEDVLEAKERVDSAKSERSQSGMDTDELMKEIDKKLKKLDMIEKATEIVGEIKKNINVEDNKLSLAFFIRRYKLYDVDFDATFDISVPALLKQGVSEGCALSKTNLALYYVEQGEFDQALALFKNMDRNDYNSLVLTWHDGIWKNENDAEGALISYLIYKNNGFKKSYNRLIREHRISFSWNKAIGRNEKYVEFLRWKEMVVWLFSLPTPEEE